MPTPIDNDADDARIFAYRLREVRRHTSDALAHFTRQHYTKIKCDDWRRLLADMVAHMAAHGRPKDEDEAIGALRAADAKTPAIEHAIRCLNFVAWLLACASAAWNEGRRTEAWSALVQAGMTIGELRGLQTADENRPQGANDRRKKMAFMKLAKMANELLPADCTNEQFVNFIFDYIEYAPREGDRIDRRRKPVRIMAGNRHIIPMPVTEERSFTFQVEGDELRMTVPGYLAEVRLLEGASYETLVAWTREYRRLGRRFRPVEKNGQTLLEPYRYDDDLNPLD